MYVFQKGRSPKKSKSTKKVNQQVKKKGTCIEVIFMLIRKKILYTHVV